MYIRYPHLERLGHQETDGLLFGDVHVMPKIDGSNASVWFENGQVCCGSRNRNLSREDGDNQGFKAYITSPEQVEKYRKFFINFPHLTLFGEWLIKHTLNTYRDEAWKRFWIFDVYNRETQKFEPYDYYSEDLNNFQLDVIPPLVVINNPSIEKVEKYLHTNTFLIQDGKGVGEGIVCKNYYWTNSYGRQIWGKIVRNEFKEANRTTFGHAVINGEFQIEVAIVEKYVTEVLVNKERAKIEQETTSRHTLIPRLLNTVYYSLIKEETWNWVKEYKNPTINFKKLQQCSFNKTKEICKDLF